MIDLRSDTVTKPSAEMRARMAAAPVGDDVFGDDPTVNALEARVAQLAGKESALLLPSGTQSNLVALLAHCQRGDEYIVGQDYHTYLYEAGGGAVFGSVQPQPIPVELDGSLDLYVVASRIKPDDSHFVRSKLLVLENTHNGKVLSLDYMTRAYHLTREHGLSLHLDGARVFNAAAALCVPVSAIACYADTISICCSKGLGAPVGSLLCGPAPLIKAARRWRKMAGGGMRQAGIVAAGIDYARTTTSSACRSITPMPNAWPKPWRPSTG
jgi:threonine aldolase